MIRQEIIQKRLNLLDKYIAALHKSERYSYQEFVTEPERYGSVERFLQLSIETVTAMGKHIIAGLELGTSELNTDIPKILAEHGYIDSSLQATWVNLIYLGNTLTYHYTDIDYKMVYNTLHNNLKAFEQLRDIFAQFL